MENQHEYKSLKLKIFQNQTVETPLLIRSKSNSQARSTCF